MKYAVNWSSKKCIFYRAVHLAHKSNEKLVKLWDWNTFAFHIWHARTLSV